jgi:hypothetical protein
MYNYCINNIKNCKLHLYAIHTFGCVILENEF